MWRSLILAAWLWTVPAGTAASSPAILGHWHVASSDMVIEVAACGDAVCGRLVGLNDPAARDHRNPDPDLAGRRLCRLQVLTAMDEDDHWRGRFYNPGDGTEYSVALRVNAEGRLELQGSTGPILLARIIPLAMVWAPVPPPDAPCEPPPAS